MTTKKKGRRRGRIRFGRILDVLLTHAAIVISGMLIVFFVIDRLNKSMNFMTNEFHKCITFALALLAIYLAGWRVAAHHGRGAAGDRERKTGE